MVAIYAQSSTSYNIQGNQALQNKDYQIARSWFSEGLVSCDIYSIQKLVEIWKEQSSMRESMRLPMQVSFSCLESLAEAGNPEAMFLLRDFYGEGIAIEKDSIKASYWIREYGISQGIPVGDQDTSGELSLTKLPRKSLLSNRFSSFLTYTYSPTMTYGFTAGICFDKIGGYVSGRNNFQSVDAAYECNNTRVPVIEIENPPYEFNRESWHSQMITGGLLYPVVKNRLFLSVGGGYGKRDYYREIRVAGNNNFSTGNTSEWCYNMEASYKGLTLEAGGMFIWKKLVALAGINSTQFKDLDMYIGLGLTF